MLISIAMMFLVGMSMGWICKKIHLPSLFGMIVTGIVLGPYSIRIFNRGYDNGNCFAAEEKKRGEAIVGKIQ